MDTMAQQISELESVVASLNEIQEDVTVPRNVRTQMQSIMTTLRTETELSIKINKALSQLAEIANDINIQSYTRTQIWNLISVLEKLH